MRLSLSKGGLNDEAHFCFSLCSGWVRKASHSADSFGPCDAKSAMNINPIESNEEGTANGLT